ncbi:type II secretion system F family protein [Arthrobacter sp. GCM10027362]|uniref:type II secretion system F family protein n=1 Tax=Arthrobacter sp. GCM10027362 TaxID=3273379 RepID=UPI00362D1A48
MSQHWTLAAMAGTGLGAGLWLVVAGLPVMRRRRFADRIYPQLKSLDLQSRLLHPRAGNVTPFGPLERIVRPVLLDAVHWLGRFNPGTAVLSRRLAQAGRSQSALEFRAEQLLWAVAGLGTGIALAVLSAAAGAGDPVFSVVATVVLTLGGFLLRDYLLGMQIQRREAKMLAEFPGLAELMALAVGAGESAAGALERICRTARGELAAEFAEVLAATRAGTPLLAALRELSNRTRLPALVRFVEGITVAVERGTPLADVLRAQAQDVRDMAKRSLMESAGKKEIGMMVP